MVEMLQVVSLVLVVLALVPAAAHALELPGKLRLTREAYFAVQPIYYPGFTIAGIGEPIAIVSTVVLLILTPRGSEDFWLTLVALIALAVMHAVYWVFTHPVNNFWLRGEQLSGLGSGFFSLGSTRRGDRSQADPVDWTDLRDRWEYSHVGRTGCALVSFLTLVIPHVRPARRRPPPHLAHVRRVDEHRQDDRRHRHLPRPFREARDRRAGRRNHLESTSLHHFALEIDKRDFDVELDRLQRLGVEVHTVEHRWCRWRSIYVRDPEDNIVELVCYDETIE
jgi:catechol 2,3-dioxygenase-like lactoylglutathione lyase family enzyme